MSSFIVLASATPILAQESPEKDAPVSVELPDEASKPAESSQEFEGVELPPEELPPEEKSPEVPPPDHNLPKDTPRKEEPPGQEPEQKFKGVILPYETPSPPPGPSPSSTVASGVPSTTTLSAQTTSNPSPPPLNQPSTGIHGPKPPPKEDEIFDWVTLSPQIGYLFFQKSEMEIRGFKATVESRNGLVFKLHLDLGGERFSFELVPLFAIEAGGINPNAEGFGNVSDLGSGSFRAAGGETAVVYRFRVKKFYPHIGLGFHGAYLMGEKIEYGAEIYGRLPVGFTAYPHEHVGIVTEIGFMFGVTGIRAHPELDPILQTMPDQLREGLEGVDSQADFEAWYDQNEAGVLQWMSENEETLPEGYDSRQLAEDTVTSKLGESIRFGRGFGLDLSVGVRFP